MKIQLFTDAMANYRRYGAKSSTQDYIKFFAIAIMIADHIGYFFFPEALWWRAVGRIGFPVWFFIAGYGHPSRPPYALLALSALMVLGDAIAGEAIFPINALLSIFFCRVFVSSHLVNQPLTVANWLITLFFIITIAIPALLLFEYGFQALLFALCGFYCRHHKDNPLTAITLILSFIVFMLMQSESFAFTLPQYLFMAVGTWLVCLYLYCFRIAFYEAPFGLGIVQKPINFFARNSHYVYFVHFLAFEFAAHALLFR